MRRIILNSLKGALISQTVLQNFGLSCLLKMLNIQNCFLISLQPLSKWNLYGNKNPEHYGANWEIAIPYFSIYKLPIDGVEIQFTCFLMALLQWRTKLQQQIYCCLTSNIGLIIFRQLMGLWKIWICQVFQWSRLFLLSNISLWRNFVLLYGAVLPIKLLVLMVSFFFSTRNLGGQLKMIFSDWFVFFSHRQAPYLY